MTGRRDLDDELLNHLVGGLEPRRVEIVDHDDAWAARFQQERAVLGRAFGTTAVRIEHIGSTAVPGLAAKPVVDILVTVADIHAIDASAVLEPLGFELRVREPAHLAFRRPDRSVNLHLLADDDD